MVAPLVALGAGMAATGAVGGIANAFKKPKSIDITQQLQRLQDTYAQNHIQNDDLAKNLTPMTDKYRADLQSLLSGQKADFNTNKAAYIGATDENVATAEGAARKNLYGGTF